MQNSLPDPFLLKACGGPTIYLRVQVIPLQTYDTGVEESGYREDDQRCWPLLPNRN